VRKPVFHFDVQWSVAKSTHGGIPRLRFIRNRFGSVHFRCFEGGDIPAGRSALVEVDPALSSSCFPSDRRTQ
jgi:hypothetical protein